MKNKYIFIFTFPHPFMPFEFFKLFHSVKPQGRKMIHPVSLPLWPVIIFLTITLISLRVPTCLCADDPQFLNCSSVIQCGNLQNISYPFWGSNRASYCGLGEEYQLTCEDNTTALLTLDNLEHRLLSYDNSTKRVTVARVDYWDNLCPSTFHNSSDPSPFTYTSDTAANNLTFYYGCQGTNVPTISIFVTSQFNCTINDSALIGYFVTKNVSDISTFGSVDLTSVLSYFGACENSVVVPAYISSIQSIESSPLNSTVKAALEQGFGLQWSDTNCAGCVESGGQCGRNESSNDFVCYCSGGQTSSTCSGGKDKVSLGIGLAIAGAAITGILLGFWIFSCRQKKMRKRAAASEAQAQSAVSKDITPPSSKEGLLPTSTSNYSRSTPSFMSTQTDIEKGSTYFGVQVFTYVELEEATQHFDPSRELGDGGFGTVYYGELQDGRVVAVKRLYENNFKRMEQFMNEVEILTRLRHKNLVMLFGCTSRRSRELLLVYEYIPNGTVADHVHGKKASSSLLPWNVRLNIAIETADALTYLHQSDVIHRDVKTNNILLDNNFRVKVADFGLSRLFPNDVTHVSTAPQGTPGYVDPEYYQCYQLTDKSDVYSFGVVLCELISSKPAVDTNRLRHDINLANMAINKIQNHALNELVDPSLGFDKDIVVRRTTTLVAELAFRCLQQEREMRPTMEEVLKCLLQIKKEEISTEKAEVVDIHADDVGQIKSTPPPFSPDSVVIDKWISNSTPNSY